MIELVVVMILLLVAVGMALRPILDGFSSATTSQSNAVSSHAAQQAIESIRSDLQAALAPQRDPGKVRDVVQLHNGLVGRPINSADPRDGGAPIDIRDVRVASPQQLVFWADVLGEGTRRDPHESECVRLTAARTTDAKFWIQREVFDDTTQCPAGNAPVSRKYLVKPGPLPPGVTQGAPAFTYALVCSRDPSTGCGARSRAPVGSQCQAWIETSPAGDERNWIVGVSVALRTVEQRGASMGDQSSSTWISLRSRETSIYRRALGCG